MRSFGHTVSIEKYKQDDLCSVSWLFAIAATMQQLLTAAMVTILLPKYANIMMVNTNLLVLTFLIWD